MVDALKAPFAPGPPKPFTAGIDDDAKGDPVPDWFPGMSAQDHDWPEDDDHPGASKASDYAWPKDHDKGKGKKPPRSEPPSHVSSHVSSHTPDQHEHRSAAGGTAMNSTAKTAKTPKPTAAEYASHLDKSTPGTQAEKLERAATAADRDADQQAEQAENFLRKARRIDHITTMEDDAENFRVEARHLKTQADARREIAVEFRNAASEKATA